MDALDTFGRPLRDLRISVTDRCNFRCIYCMPKEVYGRDHRFLDRRELLTFEEITRVARTFVSLGVKKLRITGGEPLLRRDLERLVAQLAELDVDLTLTTNGSLLPQKAQALADAGLDRITVSLDSLDDATFRALNDVDFPVERVLDGIDAAAAAGLPVKVNAVVKRGVNDDQIVAAGRRSSASAATRCASSSTWTSATRTAGGSTTSSRPRRSSRSLDAAFGVEPAEASLPRRGRAALALHRRQRRGRRHRLGHAALLRRLHPRAALGRGQALHVPLRGARPRPAGARPRRRDATRSSRPRSAAIWGGRSDRYSDLRSAATTACERSRCATSAAEVQARDGPEGRDCPWTRPTRTSRNPGRSDAGRAAAVRHARERYSRRQVGLVIARGR